MPNLDFLQAKRLADGVKCLTCDGEGYVLQEQYMQDEVTIQAPCPTCNGKTKLFWEGGWPQLCWISWWENEQFGKTLKLLSRMNDLSWTEKGAVVYPAPNHVDVLRWLGKAGIIRFAMGSPGECTAVVKSHLLATPEPEMMFDEVMKLL